MAKQKKEEQNRMSVDAMTAITKVVIDCSRDQDAELWEKSVVREFGSRLGMALAEMESDFEKHKEENPTVREYFAEALAQIMSIPSLIPKGVSVGKRVQECLVNLWNIALKALDKFVSEHKDALMIKSWSLGATVGFPIAVAGTFSVTFEGQPG